MAKKIMEKDQTYKYGGSVNSENKVKDLLSEKDYTKFVKSLGKLSNDPKVMSILTSGMFDGKLKDESFKMSEKSVPVKSLIPTQNEIDADKSLALSLGVKFPESFKEILAGNDVQILAPLVVLNDKYILDGHHRWSQIYALNKDAKVKVLSFKGKIDPIDMLKILQIAIATELREVPTAVVKGSNFFKMNEDQIRSAIRNHLTKKAIDLLYNDGQITSPKEDLAIDYVYNNIAQLKKSSKPIKNAPSRDVMPQTTEGKYVVNKTKIGAINYKQPFREGGKVNSNYKIGDKITEEPISQYEESSYLYKKNPSYVVNNDRIIVSVHETPNDAIKERNRTNLNFDIYSDNPLTSNVTSPKLDSMLNDMQTMKKKYQKGGQSGRSKDHKYMSDEPHEIAYAKRKGLKSRPAYGDKRKKVKDYLKRGGQIHTFDDGFEFIALTPYEALKSWYKNELVYALNLEEQTEREIESVDDFDQFENFGVAVK